jgi:hypothetical protein
MVRAFTFDRWALEEFLIQRKDARRQRRLPAT